MGTVREWLARQMGRGRAQQSRRGSQEELSTQQIEAVLRGVDCAERFGGVLLADAVGLGKTRVALHMARELVSRARRRRASGSLALFVVPARLRRSWERAIQETGWQVGRDAEVITHHYLSRQRWAGRAAVVVVDEAHRFRNASALRSQNLARLTHQSATILATATPVCTKTSDLEQLLSYFLTDELVKGLTGMGLRASFEAYEAGEFDLTEVLETVVIRRTSADFGGGGRPAVRFEVLRFEASADELWVWQNLEAELEALSLAATGEFWPRGLLINTLQRMWESGAEALYETLEELLHFHERWLEAARAGRRVERPQFRGLFAGVSRQQQVFDFLYEPAGEVGVLETKAVGEDLRRLRELTARVERVLGTGSKMVEAIVEKVLFEEEPFLIFAAYKAAARAIYRAIVAAAPGARVGLVTGSGARATGLGRVGIDEVLERFEGTVNGRGRDHPGHQQLRVLVATDCISEGVNLQRCSKLILADLPYSPVRLEQRIGRLARPGSAAREVRVYLPRPHSWTDSLGMRRKLSERMNTARAVGARHSLAESIDQSAALPVERGPLEAMTLEERIFRGLGQGREVPDFVEVEGAEGEGLWARVRVRGAVERVVWVQVQDSGRAVVRLAEQIPGLARLADDTREVRPREPGGRLWEELLKWVERRRQVLEAARLAPPLLGSGSEPVRVWRRIREAIESGEVVVSVERLEECRRKLLRAQPAGIRLEMGELLEGGVGVGQLLRYVEGLRAVEAVGAVEVEVVGALWV